MLHGIRSRACLHVCAHLTIILVLTHNTRYNFIICAYTSIIIRVALYNRVRESFPNGVNSNMHIGNESIATERDTMIIILYYISISDLTHFCFLFNRLSLRRAFKRFAMDSLWTVVADSVNVLACLF